MKNLTIIVYPVQKTSVQKRHLEPALGVKNEGGHYEIVERGIKPYFRAEGYTPIKFMIDRNTGKYKTGLEEIVTNDLYNLEYDDVKAKYSLGPEWDKNGLLEGILKREKIDLQTLYEIFDGQNPGTYNNEVPNSMIAFVTGAQRTQREANFISKEQYTLYTKGSNTFTTETSRGRLAIQCIKNQPSIALSKAEINESTHDWYIGVANEAEYDKARMNELVNDAIFEYETLKRKYSPFDVYRVAVQLYDYQTKLRIIQGDVNETVIQDRINAHIKTPTKYQEENINLFLDKVKLFYDDADRFNMNYLVQQGLNTKILKEANGEFLWVSQVNGNPAWYKFKNREIFVSKMLDEAKTSLEKGNYFVEFEEELMQKGIKTK